MENEVLFPLIQPSLEIVPREAWQIEFNLSCSSGSKRLLGSPALSVSVVSKQLL